MDILIVVLISLSSLLLFGVGVHIVLQKNQAENRAKAVIKDSGKYSLIRESPIEEIYQVKPNIDEVRSHLESHTELNDSQIQVITDQWIQSIQSSIAMVEAGDAKGYNTYSFDFQDKDLKVCTFLDKDSYITREQIYHHPELLPPFFIGCTTKLTSREAWDNQNKSAWVPVLPLDGQFQVPDWRSFEK